MKGFISRWKMVPEKTIVADGKAWKWITKSDPFYSVSKDHQQQKSNFGHESYKKMIFYAQAIDLV